MPKDEQVSGAPIPMKIGNTSYRARALSDKDYDELSAYIRFKFIEETKLSIDKMLLTREARQEMLTSMMLAASQVSFNSAEGSRIVNSSTEGMARVGWQMIIHHHPNVSFEEFLKQVIDEGEDTQVLDALGEINQAFIYLNIGNASESEEDSDEEPKSDNES